MCRTALRRRRGHHCHLRRYRVCARACDAEHTITSTAPFFAILRSINSAPLHTPSLSMASEACTQGARSEKQPWKQLEDARRWRHQQGIGVSDCMKCRMSSRIPRVGERSGDREMHLALCCIQIAAAQVSCQLDECIRTPKKKYFISRVMCYASHF